MNKEKIKEIIEEIGKSNKVLLHCHPSADPDSVGTALAFKLSLEQINKSVTLIQGDTPISKSFHFPGVETITKKSYSEINLDDFDTFIILDSSSLDMITSKAQVKFPENLSTIVIDHHSTNKGFGKINWIDSSYAATSLMVYDLIKEMGIKITHDIAINLIMGICTDTGFFRYGNSPEKSLLAASELAKIAPDYTKTIFKMENSHKKETLIFEGIAFSSIKTFYNDKLAMIAVSHDELIKHGISKEDIIAGYISNKLKSVEGFEIAATLIEYSPNEVKVSFRTRNEGLYDLSKITEILGGGGHKAAGGATLKLSLPEAVEKVAKNVKEIYNL